MRGENGKEIQHNFSTDIKTTLRLIELYQLITNSFPMLD